MSSEHYNYTYKGIKLDPYRIFDVYGIGNSAQQHAIKKLLRAGDSVKSLEQDIDETILTLQRWKEMLGEDDLSEQFKADITYGEDGSKPVSISDMEGLFSYKDVAKHLNISEGEADVRVRVAAMAGDLIYVTTYVDVAGCGESINMYKVKS